MTPSSLVGQYLARCHIIGHAIITIVATYWTPAMCKVPYIKDKETLTGSKVG